MKACQSDLDDVQLKIDKLRADLDLVYKCLNTTRQDPNYLDYCVGPPEESRGNQVQALHTPEDRSTAATKTDTFAIGDMYLTGYSNRCGPQVRIITQLLLIIISILDYHWVDQLS